MNSIKPNDLNELKKLTKPSDIIKLIFDCVGLLKMEQLNKVELTEITLGIGKEKKTFIPAGFLQDDADGYAQRRAFLAEHRPTSPSTRRT